MLVSSDRFAQGKTVRVKLAIDQMIQGVPLSAGDTCDLPQTEALYLKSIGRVDIVTAEAERPPKVVAR